MSFSRDMRQSEARLKDADTDAKSEQKMCHAAWNSCHRHSSSCWRSHRPAFARIGNGLEWVEAKNCSDRRLKRKSAFLTFTHHHDVLPFSFILLKSFLNFHHLSMSVSFCEFPKFHGGFPALRGFFWGLGRQRGQDRCRDPEIPKSDTTNVRFVRMWRKITLWKSSHIFSNLNLINLIHILTRKISAIHQLHLRSHHFTAVHSVHLQHRHLRFQSLRTRLHHPAARPQSCTKS